MSLLLLGAGPSSPPIVAYPERWGLVSHWSLDEASGDRADSHGIHTLTDTNTVTQATAKVGAGAAQFTAANLEKLTIADNAALSMGDVDLWLACWVYLDSKGADRHIIAKWDPNPNLEYLLLFANGADRFQFLVSGNGSSATTVSASTLGAPELATWYFLIAYHDSVSNTIGISANGGAWDTASHTTGVSNGASALAVGLRSSGTSGAWDGRIDEVSIGKSPPRGIAVLRDEIRDRLWNGSVGGAYPWAPASMLAGITFGTPMLGATFTKIDVELPISEVGGSVARAFVQTYPVASPSEVRSHLDLWPIRPTVAADITQYGSQYALYGCTFDNLPNTTYEVIARVQDESGSWAHISLGTVTTREDAIPAASTLAATRHVRTGGSDAANGQTVETAWANTQQAVASLSAGGVCVFGPGYYSPSTAGRAASGTFRAEFPAVDSGGKDGAAINAGNHSIIEPLTVSAPTGTDEWSAAISSNPYTVAPWVAVSVQGTGETLTGGTLAAPTTPQWHGGAEGAPDGTLWKWAAPPSTNIGGSGLAQVGYGSTRAEYPKKIAFTRRDTAVCDSAGGWAEILYTNQSYNDGGCWQEATTGDLYLKLPSNAPSQNPNDLWIKAGGDSIPFDVNADDVRISGLVFHCNPWPVQVRHARKRTIVDHCIVVAAQNPVRWGNGTAAANSQNIAAYVADSVVEYNLFLDFNLWNTSHQAIPWNAMKRPIVLQNGSFYNSAGGYSGAVTRWAQLENTAVGGRGGAVRSICRYNRTVGYFNGFSPCGTVVSEGRYAGYACEAYGNSWDELSDDVYELDAQGINQAVWDDTVRDALVWISLGPLDLGPCYFFRNSVYRLGRHGVGIANNETAATADIGAVIVKHGGTASPRARCSLIHNTVWTNEPDVWGPAEIASIGSTEEELYLRNNIFRVTGFVVRRDSTQPYDEDHNILVTNGLGSGVNTNFRWNGTTYATTDGYRTASSQGDHTNVVGGVTIEPTNVAVIDSLLTDTATGILALTADGQVQLVGTPVAGISDTLDRALRMGYQP